MFLRPPKPDEYEALTDLILRSKAVHGYDEAFMAACVEELTLTAEKAGKGPVQVAERDGAIIAVAQVIRDEEGCYLESLFVEPGAMGSGAGRALFEWAATAAANLGARELQIDSDPGAEGFYLAMGAVCVGTSPSASIPGRVLPQLVYVLDDLKSA